jgi:tRNA threonylcarbamoyladenosine biosynthesis protein TsaB
MVILVLDTCTERLLAGVRVPGQADRWANLDSRGSQGGPGNHARDLLPVLESLLEGQRPDVIGVALGPGSFTGVRIGLASAKGLAEGWGVPLVGLDNLAAMAGAWSRLAPGSGAAVLPAIDARKKKFYGALYAGDQVLIEPSDREPRAWVDAATQAWGSEVVLSGYQGSLLAEALGPDLPAGWSVLETRDWTPQLLDEAGRLGVDGPFLGPDASPRYLRLSEAEENRKSPPA